MRTLAGIMIAGAVGALLRYEVDGAVSRRTGGAFPWGTFVVNVSGAFVLGLLFTIFTERVAVDSWLRIAILTGFLGAYTTFSTLSLETVRLLGDRAYALALANSLGSLVAGLLAVSLGMAVGRAF